MPADHSVVLVVSRTGHRFGEHHEAAADVLGRAAPDGVDERAMVDPGISVADHLHDDSVPPVISDIATAVEPVRGAIGDSLQADARACDGLNRGRGRIMRDPWFGWCRAAPGIL